MSRLFEQETGPQAPREVRSPVEIFSLLRNLHLAREQLSITFTDRSQKFQSFIIKLDNDSKRIWLDEMIPREGDRFASQGESMRIDAWREGVHIRWDCPGLEKVMLDDMPAYMAMLPTELIYHQKRGAYRAPIRRSLVVGVQLVHGKKTLSVEGSMIDISATGCKGRFKGDCRSLLTPGDVFEFCQLDLPDIGQVAVEIEIRHAVFDEGSDETQVGLRFRQISAMAQRQVDRFVNHLQREARRMEKEDLF